MKEHQTRHIYGNTLFSRQPFLPVAVNNSLAVPNAAWRFSGIHAS